MERIIINESDLTSNSAAISSYDVAYVPGFKSGGTAEPNTPTLVTTIYQFRELFGSTPAVFKTDQYYPVASATDRGFPTYAIPDYANVENPYVPIEDPVEDPTNFTNIVLNQEMIASDPNPYENHWFVVSGTAQAPTYTLATSAVNSVVELVAEPTGNPKTHGWYEKSGTATSRPYTYVPTNDTTVTQGKDYFEVVDTQFATSASPADLGWYVLSGGEYYLSTDSYIVAATTYYTLSENTTPAWFLAGSKDTAYRYAELLLKNGLAIYYEAFNTDDYEEVAIEKDSQGVITDTRNPRKEGWFEKDGSGNFITSTDVTVQSAKTYYSYDIPSVKLFYEKLGNRVSEVTDPGFDNIGDYSIKYITSGGYPTFEYGKASTTGTQTSNYISSAMIALAAKRQDAIALIDHTDNPNRPLGANVNTSVCYQSKQLFGNLTPEVASYGTLFTPWYENSLLDGMMMPASAAFLTALAAQLRYTNPWLAVSGVSRGVVPYLEKLHTNKVLTNNIADSYQSNEESTTETGANLSINAITYIRNYGYCLWGNRTLRNNANGVKATSFLNIRNQVSDIKKQLYAASQKLLFEQNTDVLWINFKSLITPMLEKMVSNSILTTYKITKLDVDPETGQEVPDYKVLAIIKIYPINSVEVFDLTVEIDNTELTVTE